MKSLTNHDILTDIRGRANSAEGGTIITRTYHPAHSMLAYHLYNFVKIIFMSRRLYFA